MVQLVGSQKNIGGCFKNLTYIFILLWMIDTLAKSQQWLHRQHLGFLGSLFFCWLYVAQQEKFKILSGKIKCFLDISIARSRPKFKEICQSSIHGSSRVATKILQIEGCFKILTFIFNL
jgi:hypothetical protein